MVTRVARSSISGEDEDNQTVNENGKRLAEVPDKEPKKRLKTKSLYRQPTANELNRLQETANLFNSNLFRLQVEEILEEVKVKEKTDKKFQLWYSGFKNHLLSIPEDDVEYDLTEPTLAKKLKVKLPYSNRLAKTKCTFKFLKFTNIEIVGSYALGSSINSKLNVNIQITVPADTYTKNDSINYRYHKKRAAYLAVIASHVRDHETVAEINYSLDGSETKPVLDITPSGKLGKHLTVRVQLSCEPEAYKLHRFSPTRNNLREAWMFAEATDSNDVGPPTPYYNSSILQDLTASANEEFLREILSKCENLKQAVVLLKIWIRQRNLRVSGFIVSLIVAHLVQTKRVNNIMSSYQIVRNVWIALKSSEWDVKGISLYKGDNTPSLEEFHQQFPVVFLDRTGYYNLCWQMCKGTYCALRRESALAVEMLDDGKLNSFLPLFMTPVLPLLQFDHILRFKNIPKLKESVISKVSKAAQLNYGLDDLALVTDTLYTLLAKGLGNRVDLILEMVEAKFSWSVTKSLDKARKEGYKQDLSFGFVLNPENYMNNVEKGPPANLPEAEEFRAFWGAKSELRRFQDGSITETCVWAADSPAERRGLTGQIIDYLLHTKYGVEPAWVFHVGGQGEAAATAREVCPDAGARRAHAALDDLRKHLRDINLPLDVSGLAGVSPVFSYCEPLPARAQPPRGAPWRRGAASLVKTVAGDDVLPDYVPAYEAVIELGHSGKWPGDVEAFRCLKAGFYLQLAERLRRRGVPAAAAPAHLDVLARGVVLRLRLAHAKEVTLLRRRVAGGVARIADTDESLALLRDTVLAPRLRGALNGLAARFPAFGATARLVRRWASAMLLGPPLLPGAAADLLAAAAFLRARPLAPPAAPLPGLLRVLSLIANTDWRTELLVLDFNDDMSREEVAELEAQFVSRSPQSCRLHVVTSLDGAAPGAWTAAAPSPAVLARLQALAAATLRYCTAALMTNYTDDIQGAFVPSLAGYDVVIRLRRALVPRARESLALRPRACPRPPPRDDGDDGTDGTDGDVLPVVDFNPVRDYLADLRSAFDDFALFFHDIYGGDVIAVLWKPDIKEIKEFQPLTARGVAPAAGAAQCRVDTDALVEDFRLMGAGLVETIQVNK